MGAGSMGAPWLVQAGPRASFALGSDPQREDLNLPTLGHHSSGAATLAEPAKPLWFRFGLRF